MCPQKERENKLKGFLNNLGVAPATDAQSTSAEAGAPGDGPVEHKQGLAATPEDEPAPAPKPEAVMNAVAQGASSDQLWTSLMAAGNVHDPVSLGRSQRTASGAVALHRDAC